MRTLIFLTLSLVFLSSAQAAPPTDQSIEQLLFVTRAQEMMESTMAMMRPMMKRVTDSAADNQIPAEKLKALEAIQARMSAIIATELKWDTMKPMFVSVYRNVFTQEEIDGLIAFYQSPAGTAFIEKMPLVRDKTMELMQERMKIVMAKLKTAAEEMKAESKSEK